MTDPSKPDLVEARPLRVLHLFSNHKFTGPADPALTLASATRRLGHHVVFMPGRAPHGKSGVLEHARARGLETESRLFLLKHGKPIQAWRDVRRLRRWLRRHPVDVVHCHLANDHLIASLATQGTTIPIVRTIYDAEAPRGLRARVAMARTKSCFIFDDAIRHGLPMNVRVHRIDPLLDLARFEASRDATIRAEWKADDTSFVVGVVARMQTHRLFPELIEGFTRAARDDASLRLVILGRGTHQERVAKTPARESSAAHQIHFPGYVDPVEYPRYLPCFDALLFLVPGSDGTCRAAREALVSGVPVIASRRGLLPSFIDDERTGLLLGEESPAAIAAAIRRLAIERDLRDRLAERAREQGRQRFDAMRRAAEIVDDYREVIRT